MKPISVRFKCFGPYVDEQYIDFKDLEKSGLFLICGETGSGKTTILDAMCCALYGKSSGGLRGDLNDMRCKRAAAKEDTFVEYIFSSGENTYRFYRCVKPRKQQKASLEAGKSQGFNEEYECGILREGQFVPLSDTKATQKYINNKAEEILGLQYEQFKQVIILPQGQFERLLTSDSKEKEKILVKLFHADKYEKMTAKIMERLAGEKENLKLEKELRDQKLQEFECSSLEELESLQEKTSQECSALAQQYRELEEDIQSKKTAHDQAKQDDKDFSELENAEKTLAELTAQQSQIQADERTLQNAKAAEAVTPVYQEYRRCEDEFRRAEQEKNNRGKKLTDAKKAAESLQKEKQAHEENRASNEKQKEQKILLENLKGLYQSLPDKEEACRKSKCAAKQARNQYDQATKKLSDADQALEQAAKEQKQAASAFQYGQQLYLRGIGATLAEKLQEGEKCPVCGSCHHPEPAKPGAEHISEKELEILNKDAQKALKEFDKAAKKREKAHDDQTQMGQELTECRKDAEAANRSYQEALSQRAEGIASEEQRNNTLKALQKAINAFEEADRSMQDRINKAASELETQKNLGKEAAGKAEEAKKALEAAQIAWTDAAERVGFADIQAYQEACMEPDARQTLQENVIQYNTDLKNAREDVKQKKDALCDRVRPDVKKAEQALESAEKQKEAVSTRQGIQREALKKQEDVLRELRKEIPAWEQKNQRCEANEQFAKRLRGDIGISLQRYVLGVMLTSITTAANRLLKTVYGGRYQLYRTDDASGSTHKKGLELAVVDQDGERSVNSLSGGEKFLLSLSLGIGLATVVQAQGRGIRLEAMFIDEGFGSLDSKSIYDAMEILETVRSGSGIVGIISHVEQLAETIPAKIEITKTKNGSQCRVCC